MTGAYSAAALYSALFVLLEREISTTARKQYKVPL